MGLDQYIYAVKWDGVFDTKILFKNPIPLPKDTPPRIIVSVGPDGPEFKQESSPHENTYRNYHSLHKYLEKIYKGVNGKDADFNCEPMPLLPLMLEAFFCTNDPDLATPNEIDYKNLKEEDNNKSEAYFFRNWNRDLLRLVNGYMNKGYRIFYSAWY